VVRNVVTAIVISTHFNSKQQVFLDFVLAHYVSVGVEELDQEKLTPLLRLKYHNSVSMPWLIWDQRKILGRSSPASRNTTISIRLAPDQPKFTARRLEIYALQ
jgi:hypothetical protein